MLQRCSTGDAASVQGLCLEAWSSCSGLQGLDMEPRKATGSEVEEVARVRLWDFMADRRIP